jgi:hypothetical protein
MLRNLQNTVPEITCSLQIYKIYLINVKNTLNNSGHDFLQDENRINCSYFTLYLRFTMNHFEGLFHSESEDWINSMIFWLSSLPVPETTKGSPNLK